MADLDLKDVLLWLVQSPLFLIIGAICFLIFLFNPSPFLLIPLVLTGIGAWFS
jgi:hypothetical protein